MLAHLSTPTPRHYLKPPWHNANVLGTVIRPLAEVIGALALFELPNPVGIALGRLANPLELASSI